MCPPNFETLKRQISFLGFISTTIWGWIKDQPTLNLWCGNRLNTPRGMPRLKLLLWYSKTTKEIKRTSKKYYITRIPNTRTLKRINIKGNYFCIWPLKKNQRRSSTMCSLWYDSHWCHCVQIPFQSGGVTVVSFHWATYKLWTVTVKSLSCG